VLPVSRGHARRCGALLARIRVRSFISCACRQSHAAMQTLAGGKSADLLSIEERRKALRATT
jgi:hypothetical protein